MSEPERVGSEPGCPARSERVLVGDLAADPNPLVEAAHEPQAVAEDGEDGEQGEEADAQHAPRVGRELLTAARSPAARVDR